MAGQEETVRTRHGTMDWIQIGKEIFNLHAYLTDKQSTSCKMTGWMKHKVESRLPGEISIPQVCRLHHHYDRNKRGTEEPLDEGERGSVKI